MIGKALCLDPGSVDFCLNPSLVVVNIFAAGLITTRFGLWFYAANVVLKHLLYWDATEWQW